MKRLWLIVPLLCLLALLVWPRNLPGWQEGTGLSLWGNLKIQKELTQAAELCFAAADPEGALAAAGYAVVNTEETYPPYLENPQALCAFAEGQGDFVTLYRVSSQGLGQQCFFREGKELRFLSSLMLPDGTIGEQELLPVYEFEIAPWKMFYCRMFPKDDPHYIDYNFLRLEPVNRELYELNRAYIQCVGYQMVNLFLTDWQEGDWGELALGDTFEYLYALKTGENFPWQSFAPAEGNCIRIEEALFEETILPFFALSKEELRSLTEYDAETRTYLWRPVHGDDLTTWKSPYRDPQVVKKQEHPDGTLTLTVQVYSPEVKTDNLFTHEVTLRLGEEGGFQYVANRVIRIGPWGLPYAKPRKTLDAGGG